MRRLRVVASAQLSLAMGKEEPRSLWDLPEHTQVEVLALLARMIAKGVVEEQEAAGE